MAESMAEQLAAAQAQLAHLSATLEERDNPLSQLRPESSDTELSETVAALQAQALRDEEAALDPQVRVLAGGSQPDVSVHSRLTSPPSQQRASAQLAGWCWGAYRARVGGGTAAIASVVLSNFRRERGGVLER